MATAMSTKRTPRRRRVSQRTRTAYHEAGHVVLSAAINDTPHHVSIRADHGTLGRSGQKMLARPTSLAQVYLAGFAAEHLLTGRRPRQLDLEVRFGILSHSDPALCALFEIVSSDGYGAVREALRTGVRETDEEIHREIERFYEIARQSLSTVWPPVRAVAEALLAQEELDRDGLDEAIGEVDILLPVLAGQRAHGLHPG
jgi:ATP-dependent Zn protease